LDLLKKPDERARRIEGRRILPAGGWRKKGWIWGRIGAGGGDEPGEGRGGGFRPPAAGGRRDGFGGE
jgi:hypothetical protein